jgi:hypothetical protein
MADKHDPFSRVENTFRGAGKTLEAAFEDAWDQAKKSGAGPGVFRLVDLYFSADNPIREYSIVIGAGG